MFKPNIKYALILIVAGLGLIYFGFSSMNAEPPKLKLPEEMRGVIIDSPPALIPDFSLLDDEGKPFTKENLKGRWSVMFTGYTNCPDVCPTSLGVLDKMHRQPGIPEGTQFLFLSVDPGRDTVAVMNGFVNFFNKDIIGLTGDKAEIDKITKPLGVIYDYEGDVASGDYIVNHNASVYFIDPQGRERAYVLPPHQIDRVSEAFRLVTEYYK